MTPQDPSPLNLASVKFLLSTCDSVSWFLESTASASLLIGEADGIISWAEHLASRLDTLQVRKQLRKMIRISSWSPPGLSFWYFLIPCQVTCFFLIS